MSDQRAVYNAVSARGYTAGWMPTQFAARQVIKLIEEVAELAEHIKLTGGDDWDEDNAERLANVYYGLKDAASDARLLFDRKAMFEVSNGPEFAKELADVQVVVFSAAESLGVSSSVLAVQKAQADVKRGVRVL